jgi:hypothetical protein
MAKKPLDTEELSSYQILAPGSNAIQIATKKPGIPVVHASLHQAIVWGPAGINTEKTLSSTKTPGVKMYWCEHGLLLEKNGKTSIVPSANVAIAQLE